MHPEALRREDAAFQSRILCRLDPRFIDACLAARTDHGELDTRVRQVEQYKFQKFRQKVASVQGRPVSKTYITQQFLITIVFPAEETILVRFSGYLMIPEFSPFHDNVIS